MGVQKAHRRSFDTGASQFPLSAASEASEAWQLPTARSSSAARTLEFCILPLQIPAGYEPGTGQIMNLKLVKLFPVKDLKDLKRDRCPPMLGARRNQRT